LANGAYGKRIMKICETVGIEFDFTVTPEQLPVPLDLVREKLEKTKYRYIINVT
jgi:aspartate aminotransferase-like enzyme